MSYQSIGSSRPHPCIHAHETPEQWPKGRLFLHATNFWTINRLEHASQSFKTHQNTDKTAMMSNEKIWVCANNQNLPVRLCAGILIVHFKNPPNIISWIIYISCAPWHVCKLFSVGEDILKKKTKTDEKSNEEEVSVRTLNWEYTLTTCKN